MSADTDNAWVYIKPNVPQVWPADQANRTVSVWLLPKFSMLSVFCLLEPLRSANRFGRPRFAWELLSNDGQPVTASNGVTLAVNGRVGGRTMGEMLVVAASYAAEATITGEHLAWLRRMAAQKKIICGLDTGAFIMARAGILRGRRVALHWESVPAFREEFPNLEVSSSPYEFADRRLTGSGGTTSLDMMLDWLEQMHGHALATAVARQLMHVRHSPGAEAATQAAGDQLPVSVSRALAIMQATVNSALSVTDLARMVGKSSRQLTRLFHRYLGTTPYRHHLFMRLDYARRLLSDSHLSVTQAAMASGFTDLAQFSRMYKARFEVPPSHTLRQRRQRPMTQGSES